jgi:hypothetical protein
MKRTIKYESKIIDALIIQFSPVMCSCTGILDILFDLLINNASNGFQN